MQKSGVNMINDPVADALNSIKTHEMNGKMECDIKPASKFIQKILSIFQKYEYIGEFEFIDDGKSGSFKVKLLGRVNNCGVIKPRFSVKYDEWSKWEERYIPSKDFGILIVSTSQGLMTNREAKKKKIGGKLIGYIY